MNFQRTNTKISLIEDYYNHFDEDKRLKRRHGQVEYLVNMHYIHLYLNDDKSKKILDIGAGTGAYSIPLHKEGYKVTALELVNKNIEVFKKNDPTCEVSQGNALDLSRYNDKSFDLILLFGPMYHLLDDKDKTKALNEAKRVLKDDGKILVSYYMNDYAILTYGFIKRNIKEAKKENRIDESFHMINKEDDLYSMVRLEDINEFNDITKMKSINRFASDGPSDYIRTILNQLDEEEFSLYVDYILKTCERPELLGSSSHVVDVLVKD